MPGTDSPVAVARQTLRRIGLEPDPSAPEAGVDAVLMSGRSGPIPVSWGAFPAGERLLRSAAGRHTLSS